MPTVRIETAHFGSTSGVGRRTGHDIGGDEEGGDEGNRTPDIYLAKVALYQLSYVPEGERSG